MGAMEQTVQCLTDGERTVDFTASDECSLTHTSTTVLMSKNEHSTGSSDVRLKTIVDYAWESRVYSGRIVACHNDYLAYAIKGRDGGVLRIVNRVTNDRTLVKGMQGAVQDLAFAHCDSETLLAAVDEAGTLTVTSVAEDDQGKLVVTPCMTLHRRQDEAEGPVRRSIVWCPYIPDDDSEDESEETSRLLLFTHGQHADLLNLTILSEDYGPGPHQPANLTEGFIRLNSHADEIVDASFSPDGSAIATASKDGLVRFFQTEKSGNDGSLQVLHEWQPHDGKPLSCLLFLDNHQDPDPKEAFWKFAMTGACGNTELKVWSCQDWKCLQTVLLQSPPDAACPAVLTATVDPAARHVLLSDVASRLLYVLQLQDADDDETQRFDRVRQLRLMNPALSLAVRDTSQQMAEHLAVGDDGVAPRLTEIRCFLVQPRSLQQCTLVLAAQTPDEFPALKDAEYQDQDGRGDSFTIVDAVSDLNSTMASGADSRTALDPPVADSRVSSTLCNLGDDDISRTPLQLSVSYPDESGYSRSSLVSPQRLLSADQVLMSATHEPLTLNLMTPQALGLASNADPDQLTSDKPDVCPESVLTSPLFSPAEYLSSPPPVTTRDVLAESMAPARAVVATGCRTNETRSAQSGGSSPSIEVQEILNGSGTALSMHADIKPGGFPSPPAPPDALQQPQSVAENGWPPLKGPTAAISASVSVEPLLALMDGVRNDVQQLSTQVNILSEQQQRGPADIARTVRAALQEHAEASRSSSEAQLQQQQQAVSEAVRLQFRDQVLPLVTTRMQALETQLRQEMSTRIGDVEAAVKEAIRKNINGKQISDGVTAALTQSLQATIASKYRDMFSSSVLPSYERATRELVQQVSGSFTTGTRDYLQQVEAQCERQRKQRDPGLQQLQTQLEAVRLTVDHVSSTLTDSVDRRQKQLQDDSTLLQQVHDQVRRLSQQQQADARRSGAATPMPTPSSPAQLQERIRQLVAVHQYNGAFQTALAASDLSLVVFLCRLLEPHVVFAETCALQQPVLLALIQQLSADLASDTELKLRYLQEAVVYIEPQHEATREHLRVVLTPMQAQLNSFQTHNPRHKLARGVRMLLLAVRALLTEPPLQ